MIEVLPHIWEGLETIRLLGRHNMFDIQNIIQECFDFGYEETGEWIQYNQDLYIDGLFCGFTKKIIRH